MATPVRLAYYCSGHGYGHATRVSAFASSLLSLSLNVKPEIHVVSSAPSHVFSGCIGRGAHYRYADVDPIIVQPLAYKVDRRKSLEVLQGFLSEKEDKLAAEIAWLLSERIDCVLSDAAFLACEAATNACIPSILITNFTFDSVYSYLGAEVADGAPGLPVDSLQVPTTAPPEVINDVPVPEDVLAPLVSQLLAGYRHADVLLLLPGFIPIPSFFQSIPLPAPAWVDPAINKFRPEIESALLALSTDSPLHSSISFPSHIPNMLTGQANSSGNSNGKPPRAVKRAPLLVRPASPHIYTPEGRSNLLSSIGIPNELHDPSRTQILVVSFGGQKIRRPHGGRSPSRVPSPPPPTLSEDAKTVTNDTPWSPSDSRNSSVLENPLDGDTETPRHSNISSRVPLRRSNSAKIFIPGAPAPANNPASPLLPNSPPPLPVLKIIEPCGARHPPDNAALPSPVRSLNATAEEDEPSLLPSSSWIAIICGVPSNWSVSGEEEEALPPGFYLAPPDVYMPDLTAVADVLMGKLGYGTVSEAVAHSTPFVYVPRPLFVEEHGLRLFLEAEGTGVELSREEYESGEWASKVQEAYLKGKKTQRRGAEDGIRNAHEVQDLASWVVGTVEEWKKSRGTAGQGF